MPYYHISFKFEGKKECTAQCATFWVDDNLSQSAAFDQCFIEAHRKLKEFFYDVFPDEFVATLPRPEITGVTILRHKQEPDNKTSI